MAQKPLPLGERNPEIETELSRLIRREFLNISKATGTQRSSLGIPRALNHHWKALVPVSALLRHLEQDNPSLRLSSVRSNMPKELVFVDVVLPEKGSRQPIQIHIPPEDVVSAPDIRLIIDLKATLCITYR